ncbi:MAG: M23 family metallopeptidase [Anaerolineae bacterium]
MTANLTHYRWRKVALIAILMLALALALPVGAAHRGSRPVQYNGGMINQSYLYGERFWDDQEQRWHEHKGVDFSYSTDTSVYAIATGMVVEVVENVPNGTGSDFGNYVLIRHDKMHWDKTRSPTGNSYVYSIYGHLSQYSVIPGVGSQVMAGQQIAQIDTTGTATGPHLHLQVCVDPSASQTLGTMDETYRSRNPELWLEPAYSGGSTGIVIGRVNAPPGEDWYIWGLSKPQGSGGTTYANSRKYAYAWTNPDDIVGENWGTTDVYPGTYHLYAKNESGTVTYADLGYVTVIGGQTSYVGLYPFYLPDVRLNWDGWTSTIAVRNNGANTASVTTTFYQDTGFVIGQRTDYLAPNASITFLPPAPGGTSADGAAIVIGSQDISVAAVNANATEPYAYAGIPHNSSPSGIGSGTTLYAPCTLNNYYGWNSTIYIQNTAGASADLTAYYYNDNGSSAGTQTRHIQANGQVTVPGVTWSGWARLVATQPIVATVMHWRDTTYMAYAVANSYSASAYLPSLLRNYYTWNSAYQTAETTGASVTDRMDFKPDPAGYRDYSLNAFGHRDGYMEYEDQVPSPWHGSGVISPIGGSGLIVSAGQHSNSGTAMGIHAFKGGARQIGAPLLRNTNWTGSLTIQNVGSSATNVTVRCYWPNGSQAGGDINIGSLQPGNSVELLRQSLGGRLPDNFEGSLWAISSAADVVASIQQSINNDYGYAYGAP